MTHNGEPSRRKAQESVSIAGIPLALPHGKASVLGTHSDLKKAAIILLAALLISVGLVSCQSGPSDAELDRRAKERAQAVVKERFERYKKKAARADELSPRIEAVMLARVETPVTPHLYEYSDPCGSGFEHPLRLRKPYASRAEMIKDLGEPDETDGELVWSWNKRMISGDDVVPFGVRGMLRASFDNSGKLVQLWYYKEPYNYGVFSGSGQQQPKLCATQRTIARSEYQYFSHQPLEPYKID